MMMRYLYMIRGKVLFSLSPFTLLAFYILLTATPSGITVTFRLVVHASCYITITAPERQRGNLKIVIYKFKDQISINLGLL